MENNQRPSGLLSTLLVLFLFLAVPAGLAYMYPQDAKEAFSRAGQIIRGEYGPAQLIPPGGLEVKVKSDNNGVTDVPLPSVKDALAAENARLDSQGTSNGDEASSVPVAPAAASSASAPQTATPVTSSSAATDPNLGSFGAMGTPGAPNVQPDSNGAKAPPTTTPTTNPSASPSSSATPSSGAPQKTSSTSGPSVGAHLASTGSAFEAPAAQRGAPTTTTPAPTSPALVFEATTPAAVDAKLSQPKAAPLNLSLIAGSWSGTFEGPVAGKLQLAVGVQGALQGQLTPAKSKFPILVEGRVLDRAGNVEFHQAGGVKPTAWNFQGRIAPEGGEGQWVGADAASLAGTWSVARGDASALAAAREAAQQRMPNLQR